MDLLLGTSGLEPETGSTTDPMNLLGRVVNRTLERAKEGVGGAVREASLQLVGRGLTPGEVSMYQAMFGTLAGCSQARIYPRNFWWPADFHRPMTPQGAIWFDREAYRGDYSALTVPMRLRAVFMHEATHLYQTFALGWTVGFWGMFDRLYDYKLVPGRPLRAYRVEQMAQIVEDYYVLAHGGNIDGDPYSLDQYRPILPVRAR